MAITITWADVVALAAELSTVPVATQAFILAALPRQMNEDVWGGSLNLAATYLAAHLATVIRRRGAGGSVQSQTAGGVSQAFAISVARDPGGLTATSYGTLYESLLLALPATRFAIA